jgi:hypothetical protein
MIRHSLAFLCPGAHFCLSNTRVFVVLVGKLFQYQTPVAFPFSTTMTIGTNLPTPLPILTMKHRKKWYCSTISSVDPPKTNPTAPVPFKAGSTLQEKVRSLVHMCLHLCKKKSAQSCAQIIHKPDYLHTDKWEFAVFLFL